MDNRFGSMSISSPQRGAHGGSRTNAATPASDRTYVSVRPAAVASRQGHIIHAPQFSQAKTPGYSSRYSSYGFASRPTRGTSPDNPTIPQSQEVKQFIKEPSYSTMLQLERDEQRQQQHFRAAAQTGRAPMSHQICDSAPENVTDTSIYTKSSNLSHASYYSELEALKSTDSQCSVEDQYQLQKLLYNSPPSPVSSSYSELKQATKYPPGYYFQQQQLLAAGPANYDSLYEPIQRRNSPSYRKPATHNQNYEFVASSNSSESSDYFGLCAKCEEKIIGEGTGCSAMGRMYHITCFTCHHCHDLLQEKPFYALDGKPYCQRDYMNTFEKCCKCLQPIQDRILRATGKPYHPHCFMCVVCKKSLDGVPFTVDATNQIHCIPCFHQRFAPKCSVCKKPIMPENGQEETVRVVVLDRSFHVNCYRCEDCNLLLSSKEEGSGCYPVDEHVLCKRCSTKRIQDLTNRI